MGKCMRETIMNKNRCCQENMEVQMMSKGLIEPLIRLDCH